MYPAMCLKSPLYSGCSVPICFATSRLASASTMAAGRIQNEAAKPRRLMPSSSALGRRERTMASVTNSTNGERMRWGNSGIHRTNRISP